MVESRNFTMDDNLLRSVMKHQAGTLQKAVLEAVMNSIEAGAKRVEVALLPRSCRVADDGLGITTRRDLELHFERFGTPHTASEGKTWARFRMGRGQMFAFGRNTWRTGPFRMRVDIDRSLSYDLEEGLEPAAGCDIDIELYDPLSESEIAYAVREITRYIKYVEPDVFVNGRKVNTPASGCKWDKISTEDAWIKLSESAYGGVEVYNLGVFVENMPSHQYGVAGTIVSRKRLEVNFARNEVIRKRCPVWRAVSKLINREGITRVKRKPTLTDDERVAAVRRIASGEERAQDYRSTRLFRDVSGALWSVATAVRVGFSQWTVAPGGDRLGDVLVQQGLCLALGGPSVEAFGLDHPTELLALFPNHNIRYVPYEQAVAGMDRDTNPMPREKWTPRERVVLKLARVMLQEFRRHLPPGSESKKACLRDLRIGTSSSAIAWTDGWTHITFAREHLKRLFLVDSAGRTLVYAVAEIAENLCHEISHADDCMTSVHGEEFKQSYYTASRRLPHVIAQGCSVATAKWYDAEMKREKEADRKRNGRAAPPPQPQPGPQAQADFWS